MKLTASSTTIEKLQEILAADGHINSDNGPQFARAEFEKFCKIYEVIHIDVVPYHTAPTSNGQAERVVKSFKEGLEKVTGRSLKSRLLRNLL